MYRCFVRFGEYLVITNRKNVVNICVLALDRMSGGQIFVCVFVLISKTLTADCNCVDKTALRFDGLYFFAKTAALNLLETKKGGETMLTRQDHIANETKAFLQRWGLKQKYVASVCRISPKVLSEFVNHKLALSNKQMDSLTGYILDYERRNS